MTRNHPKFDSNAAPTCFIEVDGEQIAYRRLGPEEGIPLLLCHRFRGTMDHWDPALVDVLAATRPVILFDSRGVGRSSGVAPSDIAEMAAFAAAFLRRLAIGKVDVLGWSMGGAVALSLALQAPGLVRRLILAGTGPGGVPDAPPTPAKVWEIAGKPVNDDEDFLFLFFADTPSSLAAGRQHLARLGQRKEAFGPQVRRESVVAQLTALGKWGRGLGSAWSRLPELRHPTLVANGHSDVMIHAYNSYAMAQRLPDAALILYPDSGHGFLFQYPERFGGHVNEFLSA